MRNVIFGLGIVVVGGMAACGGDDTAPPIDTDVPKAGTGGSNKAGSSNVGGGGDGGAGDPSGGKAGGGKGGTSNTSGSGAGGDDAGGAGGALEGGAAGAGGDAGGGPAVMITAPVEVTDPNDAAVLIGTEVTVTCLATPEDGGAPVNTSSAEISLLDSVGVLIEKKTGTPTATPNEFTSTFELTGVGGGKIGFSCRVKDQANGVGRDLLYTLLDKGPSIVFVKPAADSVHPLAKPLDVVFNVVPAPLGDGDLGAAVNGVALTMGGKTIPLAGKDDGQGKYQLQVNLADPVLFTPSPSGSFPIAVKATNKRMPTAVQAVASENIVIDGAGPAIAISSPADADVVGTKVIVKFTVNDLVAGVDPATVAITLNSTEYKYTEGNPDWAGTNVETGSFWFQFDARQFTNARVQITVNITAKDLVGNLSESGPTASRLLYLDNFPPLIDLDPLNIRTLNAQGECSVSFDPAGTWATNDLATLEGGGVFRALVWEQTNFASGVPFQHYALTNQNSVRLYFEPAGTPLLIDKDNDAQDTCDDVTQVDSPRSLGLEVVPKGGQTWFAKGDEAEYPSSASLTCTTKTGTVPPLMCTANQSDMWQVIERPILKEPAIYAPSVTASTGECTGQGWEFGSIVTQDGWHCFAARVTDKVGNVGVSRPLRICVDDPDLPGSPPCANSSVDAPSCTDGCTPAARVGVGGVTL
jgi:hypothetical protein